MVTLHGAPNPVFRHPSAVVPVAMSLAALLVLIVTLSIYGVTHDPDEGTAAHLWQLLMAGQIPVIAYFAIRWLPTAPGSALRVLAVQILAALVACFPVYYFQL